MTNELQWKSRHRGEGEYADIGSGLGRYIVTSGNKVSLRLNGELIGTFNTVGEAKVRAQAGADNARAMKTEEDAFWSFYR